MAELLTALPETLFEELQKEKFVLLATVDAETNSPQMNAISWVYAVSPTRIRFAVDKRSRIIANLQANRFVSLSFFGSGSFHTATGNAVIVTDALEEVPFKLTCVDVEIETLRDAMFYGSKISVEPEYEKTYDQRAAAKLDGQVYNAMKKA